MEGQIDQWRMHVQLKVNLGQPVTNIGANIITEYLGSETYEMAAGIGATYHFRNMGPPVPHTEYQFFASGHYLWADREPRIRDLAFIKSVDSGRSHSSIGYTFEYFYNRIGTRQPIGTLHYRDDGFIIQFSNDLLGHFDYYDKFRTGAIGIGLIHSDTYLYSSLLFWTGDSHGKNEIKHRDGETDYPARWGYRDITENFAGKYSHGIWKVSAQRGIGYGQNAGVSLGADAEQIRNLVQNQIFHDLYFIPTFLDNPKNLHLPMKMANGENYLYEEGQEIRPAKFVWQLSLNPDVLY